MRTKWIIIAVAIVVALFAIGAAACSDDDDDSPETTVDGEAQLCSDLADLDVALNAYGDIDADGTKAELVTAQQDVNNAFEGVAGSIGTVADLGVADLQTAVQAMDQAVSDIPDDATIDEGLTSLGEEAAAVDAALQGLLSGAGC
ncbi:MAG: hypothetical protein IIC89_06240 [Chloroflexi bacterium]|nr:hypothetical protein [Chloroflexota bacterium]